MIIAYLYNEKFTRIEINQTNEELLKEAIWIDLFAPTKDEENLVEAAFKLEIPTRDEMAEIELSSRLYKENDSLFMTVTILSQSSTTNPTLDPMTCILTPKQFITLRYTEPQCYPLFLNQIKKNQDLNHTSIGFFIEFVDANIDYMADTLELIAHRLDHYSKIIFQQQNTTSSQLDYRQLMQQNGANGELNTKTRESLLTFNRLISFFTQMIGNKLENEDKVRLSVSSNDISALSDHANFIANKVIFLLEATLGMVNIEQNNIIKIFSVVAVIFLPPTLIASIYGMNFVHIPELSWKFGYVFALIIMLVSAWIPYHYFKSKKWL